MQYPESLYEGFLSNLHITSLQERRCLLSEKYVKTISKPRSKLYVLLPASNEADTTHVLRRSSDFH